MDHEGAFTRTDGSTGSIFDVRFRLDNFDTVYLGDTSVSAEAAALPNVKGRGTLTDLHVAMTQDPALLQAAEADQPRPPQSSRTASRSPFPSRPPSAIRPDPARRRHGCPRILLVASRRVQVRELSVLQVENLLKLL